MAQRRTQHKRSSVAGAVPTQADMLVGEIAINFADKLLHTRNGANAIIKINSNIYLSETAPIDVTAGDGYLQPSTGAVFFYYDAGTGEQWNQVNPDTDLSGYLALSGGSMSGQITLLGGGSGSQAISVSEAAARDTAAVAPYLPKAGGTMSGQITLPGGGTGSQAVTETEMTAAIAAIVPISGNYLLKSGGTMTGQITLPGGGAGNQAISVNETAAAFASHVSEPDPHPLYLLAADIANKSDVGHTHVAANISDSTAPGRALLTAPDTATQRFSLEVDHLGTLSGLNTRVAAYTFAALDRGKIVELNGASATFTVPPNTDVAFPLSTRIDLTNFTVGLMTIAPGAGVTIHSAGGKLKLRAQYSGATLFKRGTDEWYLWGDLA